MINNLVVASHNICPSVKEYKMQPLERKADAYTLKIPKPAPKISPNEPFIYYRVIELKDNDLAGICDDMKKFTDTDNMRSLREVDVSSLGKRGIRVGDILGYKQSDVTLSKPVITHRASQIHQHPKHLLTAEETQ